MKKALCFDDVLLVPRYFKGSSRSQIDLSTTICDGKIKLQIPIIAANMPSVCGSDMLALMADMGGLGILHRMCSIEEQVKMLKDAKAQSMGVYGAAIGVGEDWLDRANHLIAAGVDVICIDVAHANQRKVNEVMSDFCEELEGFPLIVGNYVDIHSPYFSNISLKLGVGGGSMCSTRIQTGCGVPTLQSLLWAKFKNEVKERKISYIADGGIKNSGDIVKSLAAGASAVMIGSLLAGTKETPGPVIKSGDKKFKVYRGSASYGSKKKFFNKAEYIEGEETLVPYKGSAQNVIKQLCEGIRSGLSYCGVENLQDLPQVAEFVEISPSGMKESKPHGLL